MDNKKLGSILIGIGVFFLISLVFFKMQIDDLNDLLIEQSGGNCFLDDGKCIHDKNQLPIYIGVLVVAATLALGIYLSFFDKSQKYVEESHEKIVGRLEETRKEVDKDEKFEFLLKGLDEYEKKVVKAVKEQDGITQATLRIRVDMSKAKLSSVLGELEKRNLIKKVPDKKTNKIFLKTAL
ncbi:MAG: hypothetical protein CMH64_02080 [Nanoarchaeota archaeon]|nr:hypothetical protein [Nanoarchaeota archaeon]|tara:strand:- start:2720 stop:3262 length:543 start_codon:yes stop_codon:yes gene_type:complete